MPRVRTPRIVWGATSRRVLTMEWIDGVKLTNRLVRRLLLNYAVTSQQGGCYRGLGAGRHLGYSPPVAPRGVPWR